MKKFKIGDKVKVITIVSSWENCEWVPEMDGTVGEKGRIVGKDHFGYAVVIKGESRPWYYPKKALKLINKKTEFNKNGVPFPVVDDIVLYGLRDALVVCKWHKKNSIVSAFTSDDDLKSTEKNIEAIQHCIDYFGGNL